jgi:hypothetical protein
MRRCCEFPNARTADRQESLTEVEGTVLDNQIRRRRSKCIRGGDLVSRS